MEAKRYPFSLDGIQQFIYSCGSEVNHVDLVAQFKEYLEHPRSKENNRVIFKEFVSTLCKVYRNQRGGKSLVLRPQYRKPPPGSDVDDDVFPSPQSQQPAETFQYETSGGRDDYVTVVQNSTPTAPAIVVLRDQTLQSPITSTAEEENDEDADGERVTVKERAKHLNKLQSETDLRRKEETKRGKENRAQKRSAGRDDDANSVVSETRVTLDDVDRAWLKCCCRADYHEMVKLLRDRPELARHQDFVWGFTSLHWAAKQGNLEVIKLIASTLNDPQKMTKLVNTRSHGGYTPLHLSAMHGHDEALRLLVHYGADPNTRDYNGRQAKQYLRRDTAINVQQLLQVRKLSAFAAAPLRRPSDLQSVSHEPSSSRSTPHQSPGNSPTTQRRIMSQSMAPPDYAPLRRGSARSMGSQESLGSDVSIPRCTSVPVELGALASSSSSEGSRLKTFV